MALTARRGERRWKGKGEWRVRQSRKDTSRAWKVRVTLRLRLRQGQAVRQMKGLRNELRQELRQRQRGCAGLWYRWLCCFYGIRQNDNNKYKHTHWMHCHHFCGYRFVVFSFIFTQFIVFQPRLWGTQDPPEKVHPLCRQATASRRRTTNYSLVEILWSLSWPPLKHFFKADAFLYCLLLF